MNIEQEQSAQPMLPDVKFFNLAPLFTARFWDLSNEFIAGDRRLYRFHLWLNISFAFVGAVGLYALFGRIANRIFAGILTVGDVAIYTSNAMQLQGTVQSLAQTVAGLREHFLHLDDLRAYLAIQPATHSPKQQTAAARAAPIPMPTTDMPTSPCPAQRGVIEFDSVSFTYPDSDEPALANLSFCLEAGETVAIVGENIVCIANRLVHLYAKARR